MNKKYIIYSLKHSDKHACFWRADDCGYTENPWLAGVYDEETVMKNQSYYNNGYETVAIELKYDNLLRCGLIIPNANKNVLQHFKKMQTVK